MRSSVVSSALVAAFVLTQVAAGYAPALCQDFSITNQAAPANPARRDVMRQLQAWWDVHAYYPRHASNNDESGTAKVHLVIQPDGRIWTVDLVGSSGSRSLDAAASSVFRDAFVRPFPAGEPKADIDVSLHYVLAHRRDQPVAAASVTPVSTRRPFTVMNEPVTSPILNTMLQRVCTGTEVRGGMRNHPIFGVHSSIQAIFFRKPDGSPWVKFDGWFGFPSLSPVVEVGKMVQWTGSTEFRNGIPILYPQYTAWSDGENNLSGTIGSRFTDSSGRAYNQNGGYVDLTCSTEVLPKISWSDWHMDNSVPPPGDPP